MRSLCFAIVVLWCLPAVAGEVHQKAVPTPVQKTVTQKADAVQKGTPSASYRYREVRRVRYRLLRPLRGCRRGRCG